MSSPRLLDIALSRLDALLRAAGLDEQRTTAIDVIQSLIGPWAHQTDAPWTRRLSEISDDGTPIEFSVAMSERGTDVRVLFEPQAATTDLAAYRAAALALHDRLERDFGADLSRFRAIQDLFAPPDMAGPFALWSSVVFSRGCAPSFKTYFNPQARGVGRANALVDEALERLGLPRAPLAIARHQARRGPWLDEIKYFALDLEHGERSRIKVYVRHHEPSPDDLERACAGQRDFVPESAASFARALGVDGLLAARAPFTCSVFVEGDDDRASGTTLYVPVCAYGRDDEAVRRRIGQYLTAHGLDSALYDRVLRAFAKRPLTDGVGMQSWLSVKRDHGAERVTLYLATEANRVHPPGSVPAADVSRSVFASAGGAAAFLARYALSFHPLMRAPSGARAAREVLARAEAALAGEADDELSLALAPYRGTELAASTLAVFARQLGVEASGASPEIATTSSAGDVSAIHAALWSELSRALARVTKPSPVEGPAHR